MIRERPTTTATTAFILFVRAAPLFHPEREVGPGSLNTPAPVALVALRSSSV